MIIKSTIEIFLFRNTSDHNSRTIDIQP